MALDSMTYHTLYTLNIGGMVTFTCHQKTAFCKGKNKAQMDCTPLLNIAQQLLIHVNAIDFIPMCVAIPCTLKFSYLHPYLVIPYCPYFKDRHSMF